MNSQYDRYIEALNSQDVNDRLKALKKLMSAVDRCDLPRPVTGQNVNNHIHTIYSFSPYSPTKALWMGYNAGLSTAGIMDHDSISGAREFIEAGRIIGMPTTIGVECRVDFSTTELKGRRINNPDQKDIAYIAIHGIPHTMIDKVKEFFTPFIKERNIRNRQMVDRLNATLKCKDIHLDYDRDVVPISKSSEGGTITERHILFALAHRLIQAYGKGPGLVDFLKNRLELDISPKLEQLLLDADNPFYAYDLLGVLKSDMVSSFYINADRECPDVRDVICLCRDIGAISAYAYLGDVGDSVTGDKKSQKFEDDYLEQLFKVIKELGFNAVTYMPTRNTKQQLKRVKALCESHQLFQISGEDINSPRQSFICKALEDKYFHNLIDSTWALIGHEREATKDIQRGMFSPAVEKKYPNLNDRIRVYKNIGKTYEFGKAY
ncbi:MAG: PHP domain-containing protein [Mahellales bacterium]|jgi:hypothetical protein